MSEGKTALVAVQAAAMALLVDDPSLQSLAPGGVWDYVPAQPTWPFVCLESAEEAPDDTYGAQGRKVHLTFSIFSTFQGRSEQFLILDDLVRLLRHVKLHLVGSPPILTGWEHLQTWHTGSHAISPFDVGNTRAGSSQVSFEMQVLEKKS